MIKGSRLGFSYFWDGESIPVFKQANIELKEGEWTALLGCNGCGKSTLVRLMNGLLQLQDGNLSVNGINAGNLANKWELCRICGMVFQNPDNQFVSSVLEEDIAFGLENAQVPEREVTSKVKAALELVGLEAVSYTHLDVYKRQGLISHCPASFSFQIIFTSFTHTPNPVSQISNSAPFPAARSQPAAAPSGSGVRKNKKLTAYADYTLHKSSAQKRRHT